MYKFQVATNDLTKFKLTETKLMLYLALHSITINRERKRLTVIKIDPINPEVKELKITKGRSKSLLNRSFKIKLFQEKLRR